MIIAAIILMLKAHHVWPAYTAEVLWPAAVHAVESGTPAAPAEFLMAIAQHESDLSPNAVSWRQPGGKRVDLLWRGSTGPQPPEGQRLTCGYLQAMADSRDQCLSIVGDLGGMRAGAAELSQWAATCRGDLGCIARGHAGGTACAMDATACGRDALAISRYFVGMAARLR